LDELTSKFEETADEFVSLLGRASLLKSEQGAADGDSDR